MKNIYSNTWITTGVVEGVYKDNEYTPKEIIGLPYLNFCCKKESITNIGNGIVKIKGKGYGRIRKSWDHTETTPGIKRYRVAIEIIKGEAE